MHTLSVFTANRPPARKLLPGLFLGAALASASFLLGCTHWPHYNGICVPIRLILA
ncbi:hypothetical protein ACNFBT_08105 [Pseudomonas sp. NY15181]|uniref:hypothetical protein n=1 Tax=Pseudomonas sp. NY15181 TaxID=3400349 RepID=UPI003A83E09E